MPPCLLYFGQARTKQCRKVILNFLVVSEIEPFESCREIDVHLGSLRYLKVRTQKQYIQSRELP